MKLQEISFNSLLRRVLGCIIILALGFAAPAQLDAKNKHSLRRAKTHITKNRKHKGFQNRSSSRRGTPSDKYIEIDKPNFKLYLKNGDGSIEKTYPVALGKNTGQKTRLGDHKTPEGRFKISMIQPSAGWPHDFGDGKGARKGAYGPWFFRLNCPQSTHIGIHGTCFPEQTGTRASDGCIRLRNEDIEDLKPYVFVGMPVIIIPD